jgi:hypothetical protein
VGVPTWRGGFGVKKLLAAAACVAAALTGVQGTVWAAPTNGCRAPPPNLLPEEGLTLTGFFDFTATQQDKGN